MLTIFTAVCVNELKLPFQAFSYAFNDVTVFKLKAAVDFSKLLQDLFSGQFPVKMSSNPSRVKCPPGGVLTEQNVCP